jgi:hypothetical protein
MTTVLRFAVPIAALLVAALPSHGLAGNIQVPPGVGTLQAAIDAASPGDVIQLEEASRTADGLGWDPATVYYGPVTVNKAVRLQGATGPGRTRDSVTSAIVADCSDPIGLDVAADGVTINGLNVSRYGTTGIRIAGRSRVKLREVGVGRRGCSPTGVAIEVDASTNVRLERVGPTVRMANLAPNARVSLNKGNLESVLLANVQAPNGVKVSRSQVALFRAAGAAITLQNADGVSVSRNFIVVGGGASGIVVDADSADNRFLRNLFGSTQGIDVVDDGASNCWKANTSQARLGRVVTGNASTVGCP